MNKNKKNFELFCIKNVNYFYFICKSVYLINLSEKQNNNYFKI